MLILLVQESENTDFVLLEPRILFIFQFSLPASGGLSPVSELCRILRFCPHRKQSLPQEKLESKWPSHMDKYTSQCTGIPAGTLPSLGGLWLCWASPLGRLYENILVQSFLPPHLYLFLASYFLNFFRDMLIKSTDFLPSLTLHTLIYSKQTPAHTWRLSAHPTHHDTLQRFFVVWEHVLVMYLNTRSCAFLVVCLSLSVKLWLFQIDQYFIYACPPAKSHSVHSVKKSRWKEEERKFCSQEIHVHLLWRS